MNTIMSITVNGRHFIHGENVIYRPTGQKLTISNIGHPHKEIGQYVTMKNIQTGHEKNVHASQLDQFDHDND